MDYESLYEILPKEPKKWQISDVIKWLKFIGLLQYEENFTKNSIDGSCLELIEERDLDADLNITQKIVKKKLMNWIQTGLKEYTEYIQSRKAVQNFQESELETQFLKCKFFFHYWEESEQIGIINETVDRNSLFSKIQKPSIENNVVQEIQIDQSQYQQSLQNNFSAEQETMKQQKKTDIPLNNQMKQTNPTQQQSSYIEHLEQFIQQPNYELIIKPTEGNQTSFYSIKESGGKIGRHSSNQILILEESISRYHAEIIFKEEEFYLKDVGSTTGTFIKIDQKIKLSVGMMFELGSNQFEVEKFVLQGNTADLVLGVFEGLSVPNKYPIRFTQMKQTYSIGRKPTADINFIDDHHLSNIHAKIHFLENEVHLEDLGSTNGSWLRLSKESEVSDLFKLDNDVSFKIGTTSTYICKKQLEPAKMKVSADSCIICCENDRDALYMPCKHNAGCLKCSKSLKECPICRKKIEDIIRIYKN